MLYGHLGSSINRALAVSIDFDATLLSETPEKETRGTSKSKRKSSGAKTGFSLFEKRTLEH